jgi:N-acetylmuramoyl-L-alanine amidase
MWGFLAAFFSILFAQAANDAPPWVLLDKVPMLTLEQWASRTGFRMFAEPKTGRILLERKGVAPLILLMDQPYALRGERFLALPDAPILRGDKILFSAASAERALLPLLPEKEKQEIAKQIRDLEGQLKAAPCILDRPVKRIFIDPGHGGTDIGTKQGSIYEKDIVLKLARLTADELRRRGFDVSFSRTKDVFLPLEIRSKLGMEWKADVFLSLHVNHSPSAEVHGTETYILSQEATDAEARKLALIENSIASAAPAQQSAVQDILWDMEQTAYLQDSAYLASYVQESLVNTVGQLLRQHKVPGTWKNRGVRQAPFYVLNRAAMPAVLVELGYLSHARDRKLLTQKIFQESLAKGLAEGVKKYKDACRSAR